MENQENKEVPAVEEVVTETAASVETNENDAAEPVADADPETPVASPPPVEENVTSTEASPMTELVKSIQKAGFKETTVSHKDYVLMLRDGFVDNDTKKLITGEQLLIDPALEAGMFFDTKLGGDQGEGAE